jgi:hypothetical protein
MNDTPQRWRPIAEAPRDGRLDGMTEQMLCAHAIKRWIRFGRFYPAVGKWYYSGTSERSQWAQVEDDAPTHWMPLPAPPED